MLSLSKLVQRSALVMTGVTIGAALWKSRSGSGATAEAGPLRQSVSDLEARLATLEDRSLRASQAKSGSNPETISAVASLGNTVASLTARCDSRLAELETRVSDHEMKLKDVPTLTQMVSTMDEMLASAMKGLDQKLAEQVHSIDTLKTTVAQSDALMEKVLDSIYSLQSHSANGDKSDVPVSVSA